MLTSIGGLLRNLKIDDDLDHLCCNILDAVSPHPSYLTLHFSNPQLCGRRGPSDNKKYVIRIYVGTQYELKDITTHVDGHKLTVKGLTTEKLKFGKNTHSFQRTYDLPEDAILETMKLSLSGNGYLSIVFDRKVKQPKPDKEDMSTAQEYRMKISTRWFKPESLNAQVVDGVLVLESIHQSQSGAENSSAETTLSDYYLREIKLPKDVNPDNLRVSVSGNYSIEAFAPRDPARNRPNGRILQIEKN